jgi:hypothetical protein
MTDCTPRTRRSIYINCGGIDVFGRFYESLARKKPGKKKKK